MIEVASNNSAEYALTSTGAVYAWGIGTDGQLGDGNTANSFETPVRVAFPAGVAIASLPTDSSPYNTELAIDTTGHVWGWGYNGGVFCDGARTGSDEPVELPLSNVSLVAGAGDHALYDEGGTVVACGSNGDGDLGDGSLNASYNPVDVDLPQGVDVVDLVASYHNSGALTSGGAYYEWGENNLGQLGDGSTNSSDVPIEAQLPGPVSLVALGGSQSRNGNTIALVAVTGGQVKLYIWGDGAEDELADGSHANALSPILVRLPAAPSLLASGGTTEYAVIHGEVYAWGGGTLGQIGNGTTKNIDVPTAVLSGVSAISATANNVVTGG